MIKRILFAFVFIFIAVPCFAQDKDDNPIDKALEHCLDKNGSTAGSVDCIEKAYQAWDKELNRAYNELMGTLSAEGKQSLKAAQTEWIKYRDLEFKLTDSVYSSMQGTMYIPMHADHRMEIVKKRALELKGYLDLLKDN